MGVDDIKAAVAEKAMATLTPGVDGAVESVTLRRATAEDAEALALVGAATFLEAFTWMLPGRDMIAHCVKNHTAQAYLEYLARPETRMTLVTAGDDAPVGYAMVCAPELPSFEVLASDIELKRIYLFSRFRAAPVATVFGRPAAAGVRPAQAMLDAAIVDAMEMGRTRLLLGTHAGNVRAIAFYRRNGFVEVGARTFQVGEQVCQDYIFAKVL